MRSVRQIDFNRDISARKRGVRRVFAAVAAVLLLGAAVFGVVLAKSDFSPEKRLGAETASAPDGTSALPSPGGAPPFTEENAVNLLLLTHEEKEIAFCVIVSFSLAENAVRVKPVSPEVTVAFRGAPTALREVFRDFGGAEVAAGLSEKYAPVHRWLGMSVADFKSLLQQLGPVTVNLPAAVDVSVESIRYRFPRGPRELTADALVNLMLHAYSGEDALALQAQAVAGVLKTHLTPGSPLLEESFFSTVMNLSEGSVTAFDFAQYQPRLAAFAAGEPTFEVIS